MSASSGWSGLVGVVLGFVLARFHEWWTKRRQRATHWSALANELEICRERAGTYVQAGIAAPSYRLPSMAFENSFAALLADGQVTSEEHRALTEFFLEVGTLNRGLDQANTVIGDDARLQQEYGRNVLKASKLVDAPGSLYQRARQVLARRA